MLSINDETGKAIPNEEKVRKIQENAKNNDYCYLSPDKKHKRGMLVSGLHPEYGCVFCFRPMRLPTTCPKCGHKF